MNIWHIEEAFVQRWGVLVPTLEIKTTFDDIDWTESSASKVGAQVVFDGILPNDEIHRAASLRLRYSAHVFLDKPRAASGDKTLAAQAIDAALRAATGWEPVRGQAARLVGGLPTTFGDRVVRVSVSFLVPAVALGLA